MRAPEAGLPLHRRLWIYQAERFPLAQHGSAVAAFAVAGVALAGDAAEVRPSVWSYLVAAPVALMLFLQLRIADEVKDADDDRRYRPERPVPRGLVGLPLLVTVALLAAVAEAVLSGLLSLRLLMVLAWVWAWMALMNAEFGAARWLRAHPAFYLVSHMAVMPLIALFVTACAWAPAGAAPPGWIVPFLLLALANGCVLEIGRKLVAPEQEREGVETYSGQWGPRRAAMIWLAVVVAALLLAELSAWPAVAAAGETLPMSVPAVLGFAAVLIAAYALVVGLAYRRDPTPRAAKRLEAGAAIWVMGSYLLLAIIALVAGAPD